MNRYVMHLYSLVPFRNPPPLSRPLPPPPPPPRPSLVNLPPPRRGPVYLSFSGLHYTRCGISNGLARNGSIRSLHNFPPTAFSYLLFQDGRTTGKSRRIGAGGFSSRSRGIARTMKVDLRILKLAASET